LAFLKRLEKECEGCGAHYPILIHKQPLMKEYNCQVLSNSEKASRSVISIPVHPGLFEEVRGN